ncbi:MAG: FAD-binding protein, partial [Candidatus Latescibacteria bacterium]|nr:FAD-binding protein [Candidatus Latescibacterota bacterium]
MDTLEVNGHDLPVHRYHTIVVGSGAAALNCAEHLVQFGVGDIAVVTDQLGGGTSHNSGSDKQTYYKSGNIGEQPESPMDHAKTLMAGGCMHGDVAYAEAVGSLQEFYHLVQNGVPFPHDIHGGYVGYKTDHDPLQRATSAGPKTSQFMVETSLKQIHRNNTAVFNRMEVIRLLTADTSDGKRVVGAVAIDKSAADDRSWGMTLFQAQNIVMATGGPGEMYECSAYPHRQIGNHGIMFEAGAAAHNLSESQFGMASTSYRWNLSGTYQQVMPNYFSANEDGGDKRNFLTDYFDDMGAMASNIFLKGYQWPLDPQKIDGPGSSIIDIAVWCETALKNRRVFMDFIQNPAPGPAMKPFDLGDLWPEAHDYLEKSDAMIPELPIARLWRMNPPSIEQYAEHGIDLETEPLELAVVCQHNNGGFVVDSWWRTTIDHLFCLGELAGTHGVK